MVRTRQEWVEYLKALVLSVDRNFDVEFGPIPGVFIQPESIVLSEIDAETNRLVQTLDIDKFNLMTQEEFDNFLKNYLMELMLGSRAVGVVFFQTPDFTSDITIPKSFPVGTDSGSYGQSVTFYTTQQAQMLVSQKTAYYNAAENVFEIGVPAQCTNVGSFGRVPPGAIRVLMRSLPNINSVVNKTSFATGGVDSETRARAIRRVKSFMKSAGALSLKGGLINEVLNYVTDAAIVGARETGFQRTSRESGAVDAYVVDVNSLNVNDYFRVGYFNLEDFGTYEARILEQQPAIENGLISVTINGVDHTDWFYIGKDTTGAYSGSVRGRDSLKVLPQYAASYLALTGEYAVVSYYYNSIIATVQNIFDADDKYVFGRDLLVREAIRGDVYVAFRIVPMPGYDLSTLITYARQALTIYINGLNISEPLEEADITFIIKSLAGVDNVIYFDLRLTTELSGIIHDVVAASNEYIRIEDTNLVIT